jgi:glycosyltransferase involved in cell wall biosynthesis
MTMMTNVLVLGLGAYAFGKEQRAVSTLQHMRRVKPYFLVSKWEDGSVSRLLQEHHFDFASAPFGYLGRAKQLWTLVTLLHLPQLYVNVVQAYWKRNCSVILLLCLQSFVNAVIPILFLRYLCNAKVVFYVGDTPRNHKFHRALGRLMNAVADRVIANSGVVERGFLDIGIKEKQIAVIYNGKDIDKFERAIPIGFRRRYGWDSQSILVGFVGQLSPNKGVENFIKAAERVVAREKMCYFLLIGESTPLFRHFEEEMRKRVGENGLSKHVIFTGRLDQIERVYADLDIVVVPSRHEDPAPNVNIEAMASEVPVVATRVGGTPEMVLDGETGFLVDKESPDQITERILQLATNKELRNRMGRSGRERVRQMFDIRKNAALVEEVLVNG